VQLHLAVPAWVPPAIAAVALLVQPSLVAAQTAAGVPREVVPRQIGRSLDVDGRLDEEEWRLAPVVDEFTQQEPAEGEPASERTEVRLLYNARWLFIGVRAFDSDPGGIIATEMRRDAERVFDEDNFQVIIDTFRDSRSGYMFVTNPLGAKLEQQVFEEGEGGGRGTTSNVNLNWNGVWHAAARQTAEGWDAELAIPLVTLRFPVAEQQRWGINFMRNIRRKNEQVFWMPIPRAFSITRVSLAGTLSGMTALDRGLDLRIKPYLLSGGRRNRLGGVSTDKLLRDAGLDVKYGVGSGLNLDLTVNTDFAQAEADEQQVNLTRFSLFFPEKRDFFLENAGQFNVGAQGNDRLIDLFFSRRIGLSDAGQVVPIVGGGRLSGKVGRHNLALLDVHTDESPAAPAENFLVARYSRDLLRRSKIGGLFINKEEIAGAGFNRTIGADTTFVPHRSITVNGFVAKTSSDGLHGRDTAFYTRAAWLDRRWNTYAEYADIDENFNAEVGFVPRVGIRTTKVHVERNPRPGRYGIRVLEPMFNVTYTTDQENRLLTRRFHHMVGVGFENGARAIVWYNKWFEQLDAPFEIRSGVVIPSGAYRFGEWLFSYSSDPSRRVYQRLAYAPQTFYDGTRKDVELTLGLRATSRMAAELEYRRNDVDLPWGDFVVDLGILRFDVALSPALTVRTLSQYNSSTRQLTTSARLNFIYRPGSDLYLVYDDLWREARGAPEVRNRQLVLKLTYLLSR
jgi:hypothetical protein